MLGAALGVLWLVLFMSPALDWLLGRLNVMREHPWFDVATGVVRLGRTAVATVGFLAALLLWASDGSLLGMRALLARFLAILGL